MTTPTKKINKSKIMIEAHKIAKLLVANSTDSYHACLSKALTALYAASKKRFFSIMNSTAQSLANDIQIKERQQANYKRLDEERKRVELMNEQERKIYQEQQAAEYYSKNAVTMC